MSTKDELEVTLELTGTSSNPLTITGPNADIEAPEGVVIDSNGNMTVTIPAGKRDTIIELTVLDDEDAEGLEEMTVKVVDGDNYDVPANAQGIKQWVLENQFITILDINKNAWAGQAADAFAAQVAAAVGTFATEFRFEVSERNKEANVDQLVVMEVPAAAAAAYEPDAAVEQQRAQLVAALKNGQLGPPPGGMESFTNFAAVQFNAINGNRGRVYSHQLATTIFSSRKITVRPTLPNGSATIQEQRHIAWNPAESIEGGGGEMTLAHEFVHPATGIGGGTVNERRATNGENQVRWETQLQLRKKYGTNFVAGSAGNNQVLVLVEPLGMPQ